MTETNIKTPVVGEILITRDQIAEKVCDLGKRLSKRYRGKPLLLIGLLKGAFVFLSDVARALDIPCVIEFITASSYGSGTVHSELSVNLSMKTDISAYHVVVVEDIIDTGRTLCEISKRLREKNPLSLEVITLLDKPSRREVDYSPDETLFTIEDRFVVGYGLDCAEFGRNLPYIGVIEQFQM